MNLKSNMELMGSMTSFSHRKLEKLGGNHGKWKINFKAAENQKRYRSQKIGKKLHEKHLFLLLKTGKRSPISTPP